MFSKNELRQCNQNFLKDLYENENAQYRVYDKYMPSCKTKVLSGKFYSKHDADDLSKADEETMNIFKDYYDRLPEQKFSDTVLESHEIGWFAKKPFLPIRKNDNRFWHPKLRTITKENIPATYKGFF